MTGLPLTLWFALLRETGGGANGDPVAVSLVGDRASDRLGLTQDGGRGVEGSLRPAITERKAK